VTAATETYERIRNETAAAIKASAGTADMTIRAALVLSPAYREIHLLQRELGACESSRVGWRDIAMAAKAERDIAVAALRAARQTLVNGVRLNAEDFDPVLSRFPPEPEPTS
jgi:hypothetical protein